MSLRALSKSCAMIFAAHALCGFTFLNDPLIENGEQAPIAGSYECEFTAHPNTAFSRKDAWTFLEFGGSGTPEKDFVYYPVDDRKNTDQAMRFAKIAGDLYVAQWTIKTFRPTENHEPANIMMFMDLSEKRKIVFLIQDTENKRSGIADLAAKSGVRFERSTAGNLLAGAYSDILKFFKLHNKFLLMPAVACQQKEQTSSPVADPAGDAFVGAWGSEVIITITEKDGDFIVNNETYDLATTYNLSNGVLVNKNPNQKFTFSAVSNSAIILLDNGKEALRWERVGAPQPDGAKSVFPGKWKTKPIHELRRIGTDFYMRSATQKSGQLSRWALSDGVLNIGSKTIKYDKSKNTTILHIPDGNKTITWNRIK